MIDDKTRMRYLKPCGGLDSPGSVLENEKALLYPDSCGAADLVFETHSASGCARVAQARGVRVSARTLFFPGLVRDYACPSRAEEALPHGWPFVGVCSSFPLSRLISLAATTAASEA